MQYDFEFKYMLMRNPTDDSHLDILNRVDKLLALPFGKQHEISEMSNFYEDIIFNANAYSDESNIYKFDLSRTENVAVYIAKIFMGLEALVLDDGEKVYVNRFEYSEKMCEIEQHQTTYLLYGDDETEGKIFDMQEPKPFLHSFKFKETKSPSENSVSFSIFDVKNWRWEKGLDWSSPSGLVGSRPVSPPLSDEMSLASVLKR